MANKKLKLEDLKVKSFQTQEMKKEVKGGFTGNCGTWINVTCEEDCDFKSIPLNECF